MQGRVWACHIWRPWVWSLAPRQGRQEQQECTMNNTIFTNLMALGWALGSSNSVKEGEVRKAREMEFPTISNCCVAGGCGLTIRPRLPLEGWRYLYRNKGHCSVCKFLRKKWYTELRSKWSGVMPKGLKWAPQCYGSIFLQQCNKWQSNHQ